MTAVLALASLAALAVLAALAYVGRGGDDQAAMLAPLAFPDRCPSGCGSPHPFVRPTVVGDEPGTFPSCSDPWHFPEITANPDDGPNGARYYQ